MMSMRNPLAFAITVHLILAFSAGAQARSGILRGQVMDERGGAIGGARVILADSANLVSEALTDDQGRFTISGLKAGSYRLKITAKGFAAYAETLRLQEAEPQPGLRITLYPTVEESAEVRATSVGVGVEAERAAGALVLKDRELNALPDDPDLLQERLQELAATSGGAPGSAEVSVDGFLTGGRLPPKSAMREIRINADLYSAEHDKAPYQGGRIEIYTKPGTLAFHGSAFFDFNGYALNARDAFAPARAPMTTRRYGLQVGGPLVRNRVGYALDIEARDIDEFAVVNAQKLDEGFHPAAFTANVPAPKRLRIGSARLDFQINRATSLLMRYEGNSNSISNQGVGGFSLPDLASSLDQTENRLHFVTTTVINRAILNEARIGLTSQNIDQRPASTAPAIVVLGAFTAGGASNGFLAHDELRLEAADFVSIVAGKHNLKIGAQLYGKRITDDRADNFNGTFTFGGTVAPPLDAKDHLVAGRPVNISGLEQYRRTLLGLPGGRPSRFSISTGDPLVVAGQWTGALFVQDEWHLRGNLAFSLGLRYEAQTRPADRGSWAPRLGLAYSPDKQRRWVLRARAGLFYDRLNEVLLLENRRLDGAHVNPVLVDEPPFINPLNGAGGGPVIGTIRRVDPTLRPPLALQAQLGFERQLPHGWKLALFHSWSQGRHVLRSRNINAPRLTEGGDRAAAARPFGYKGDILQFESSGVTNGRVLFVGINQMANRLLNIYSGYLMFDFHADTDSPFTLPQNSYDLTGELARPTFQSRHRVFIIAALNLPYKLSFAPALNFTSGTPFNITTGRDNNGDGNFNDRPSPAVTDDPRAVATRFGIFDPNVVNGRLPRNAETNPGTLTVDCNLSRTFKMGATSQGQEARYAVTFNARATNLLNHTNVQGLNGVLASPFFGLANAALAARRVELGVRFTF